LFPTPQQAHPANPTQDPIQLTLPLKTVQIGPNDTPKVSKTQFCQPKSLTKRLFPPEIPEKPNFGPMVRRLILPIPNTKFKKLK
jgi:hypothetical protein